LLEEWFLAGWQSNRYFKPVRRECHRMYRASARSWRCLANRNRTGADAARGQSRAKLDRAIGKLSGQLERI
jgi:hypothetical protein